MNKFCVERDFNAQEALHQLLSIPMVECSRVFETINLIQELSVTQVIEVRITAGQRVPHRVPQNDDNYYSKLELYMRRPAEMRGLSYYQTVKGYKYNKAQKTFVPRREEVIVLIYPHKWYNGLISIQRTI